jgi:dipeptidase E
MAPQIVGIGGGLDEPLLDYVVGLARGRRLLFVGTASMEHPEIALAMYERLKDRGDVSFLRFNPWPPAELRGFTLAHDVIVVGGGNTANMLAVWRVHGFDRVLREAWQGGVVLTGWSAGMICWFEAAVTDSFGPQLAGMRDGLGFLPGSACPHYDGEERRRPRYRELIDAGLAPGVAADDGVALHYVGAELMEAVTCRAAASAYRVTTEGEERIATRPLG